MDAAKVRWSLKIQQRGWTYDDIRGAWDTADAAADFWHAIFLNDHLYGVSLEGWSMLAAMFERTARVKGGILVLSNSFRHPSLLAKMATTMDILSGGRFIFAIGASHEVEEFTTYGVPFPSAGERVRRLDETFQVLLAAWSGEKTTYKGRYYELNEAAFRPTPVQQPRPYILVGVKGDKAMHVAAKYADEWDLASSHTESDDFIERTGYLDAVCREIGRDPATISRGVSFRRLYEDFAAGRLAKDQVIADCRRVIEYGADHVVFMLSEPVNFEREEAMLREEFIPAVLAGL